MKYFKYLAIALFAVVMVACGDDEPKNTFTREFNMIYPQLPAGHKFIKKIERKYDRGATSVAPAEYDGDHLKSINVVNRDDNGDLLNEETIQFDYKNGAIICDRSIQDVTYSFEVNSFGAIYRLNNVSTNSTSSALVYDENGRLEAAQVTTPSSSGTTSFKWVNGNITEWVNRDINKQDSVAYEYGEGAILNKGCIDIPGNETVTFTKFICAIIRNAGLYGAPSAYLPTVMKKGVDHSQATEANSNHVELKRYPITYVLDADGYVKSYTTTETPKYTVTFTYR